MIEQFNFDIQLIFAILNGKVSAAINRKLSRNFRQNGMEITLNNGPYYCSYGKRTELPSRSYVMRLLRTNLA